MPILLRIDSSARHDGSHSRALGDIAEAHWRAAHPGGRVLHRDLGDGAIPAVTAETITGFYTPEDQMTPALRAATVLSDMLIAELKSADTLLLTVPMYNFSVPSQLKAWIDQITRIGQTFAYEDGAFRGLLTTRRAIIAVATGAGGYAPGAPLAEADFLLPYLRFLLGFLGVPRFEAVTIEATTADAATVGAHRTAAETAIAQAFATAD